MASCLRCEPPATKHCKTDYDIWAETEKILNLLPCTSTFSHVEGHQDDGALYALCKVRSPLTRIAHYNIAMDKLAEQCRSYRRIPTNDDDSTSVVQDRTSSPELVRSHKQCRGGDQPHDELWNSTNIFVRPPNTNSTVLKTQNRTKSNDA